MSRCWTEPAPEPNTAPDAVEADKCQPLTPPWLWLHSSILGLVFQHESGNSTATAEDVSLQTSDESEERCSPALLVQAGAAISEPKFHIWSCPQLRSSEDGCTWIATPPQPRDGTCCGEGGTAAWWTRPLQSSRFPAEVAQNLFSSRKKSLPT